MAFSSRTQGILNLTLKRPYISNSFDNCDSNENNNNNCDIGKSITCQNVDEIATQTISSVTSSPVPEEAKNIAIDMADVWNDVFSDDTNDVFYTSNNVESVQIEKYESMNIESPISTRTDINKTDELTPFIIEANTSYENSPNIVIEEFEKERSSTPANPLNIPTPLPSPLNKHKTCTDVFCSTHDHWSDSIRSLSTNCNSPSSTVYSSQADAINSPQTPKKRRKQNRSDWSDVKRKCMKNLGKKHVSKRGKVVDEKVMRKPCKCRLQCAKKKSQEQRIQCFTKFWALGSREKQWAYAIKYTNKSKKQRCLNNDIPNARKYTYKYFLPVITSSSIADDQTINVCKNMFLNTLSVSEKLVRTAYDKYDGSTDVEPDNRGRHSNHRIAYKEDLIKSVSDHVNSFAPIEAHYVRKDSTKLYLDGSLSIARMYKLYTEWFDATKYNLKAQSERQYRDIVNRNFNLGFYIPKKDQCDDCHVFRHNINASEEEKIYHKNHIFDKDFARSLKEKDKKAAIASNGSMISAVFDFEKVLTCPHGQISIFYYKRKLSCFNFTVFDMAKRKAVCYMWDETVAKRGSNEVSSCLLDFIKASVHEGVKEFRFWSDNCTGQNRNRIVFSLYMYAAKKYKVSITHRFLVKGHTQNEGDSVHALIERRSLSKIIYTPDEWRLLVRWAKTDDNPYIVKNMGQDAFLDFKSEVKNNVWTKNSMGAKIAWNKVKEVFVDKTDPNKLFYKYDFGQESHDVLIIRSGTRNASCIPDVKPLYTSPLKISKEKYSDLVSMCDSGVIIQEHANYFRSLIFSDSVNESKEG